MGKKEDPIWDKYLSKLTRFAVFILIFGVISFWLSQDKIPQGGGGDKSRESQKKKGDDVKKLHDECLSTQAAYEQLVKTQESEIKQLKSTINKMNSTLSDLTLMMIILNEKLDFQNVDLRKLKRENHVVREHPYKGFYEQNYDTESLEMQAVIRNTDHGLTLNKQHEEKPFEQHYNAKTLHLIKTGEWGKDELWCYTDNDDVIKDIPVRWNTIGRAYKTLPPGLRLAKSTIPNAGTGVFTDVFIPVGTYLGPYDGDVIYKKSEQYKEGEYVFTLHKRGKRLFVRDAGHIERSNWTRFLNCARNYLELNLEPVQCREHVYFKTIRDIKSGSELLFFYGKRYARTKLGIRSEHFCKGFDETLDTPQAAAYISEWIC